MNINSLRMSASLFAACALLQGCGGSHYSSDTTAPTPPSPTSRTLDTAQVLTAAQSSSETDDPVTVNDGLVTLAGGSDETSDPATVAP